MRSVKSRPGSVRAERAASTNAAILRAARSCFRTRGYGATTLAEIAGTAGVAVQTVYAVFGSKPGILRALRLEVIGDAAADEAWAASLTAPDNEAAVREFARSIRLRWEHGADVVAANTDAARTDPAIRAEVEVAERIRRTGIGEVAAAMVARDPAAGPVDALTAQVEALTSTSAWETLTGTHRWSPERYERWLASMLAAALRHRVDG